MGIERIFASHSSRTAHRIAASLSKQQMNVVTSSETPRDVGSMRLMELHAVALERGLDEQTVNAVMDGADPRTALLELLEQHKIGAGRDLVAALTNGSADEREVAYVAIESVARSQSSSDGQQEVALVVACVQPIISSVLLAPVSKIDQKEFTRASLLLYTMCKVNNCRSICAVMAEMMREDENGVSLYFNTWTSETNALACVRAPNSSLVRG